MELGAERDGVEEIFIQVERARDLDGIVGHAHRVPARVRVLRFEREDERMHALEEQLFDAPGLCLDPFLETRLIVFVFDDESSFVERLRHAGPHFVEMKRFGDVIERAHLQAGDGALHFGHGRHDDDGGSPPARDDLTQQRDAVHFGHPQVGNDERHRALLQFLQRLDPGAGFDAREAFALEQPDEHAAKPRLVVDHKAAHSGEGWHRRPKYRSLAPWGSGPYVPAMTRVAERDLTHRIATRAVHAGYLGDPLSGAVMTPIYQTSTYIQEGLGRNKGYEYARTRNPTREALERNVAALEGGVHGFAFGSGLAALDAVMKLLSAGDHVVSGENVYGGSHRQMTPIWSRLGFTFTFVDGGDAHAGSASVSPKNKNRFSRAPTNPMMRLCDLKATGEIARKAKALFVVDNTFATPYFQQPLQFGADIVLHSTTQDLNGHSDMVGGMLVATRDDVAERVGFIQNSSGAVPGPFDCWLALRGTKTLALRMRQHDANGRGVAEWLEKHPRIH